MAFYPDRFFTCNCESCDLPCIRGVQCEKCNRQFCVDHRGLPSHTCDDQPLSDDAFEAKIQAEVDSLRAKIDEKALCERASELNGGVGCKIEHPPAWGKGALMGCTNYHARIRFSNDSIWLIRVPRINGSIPQSLIDYLVRSEYATLKFLETTKVPAPRVYDFGVSNDHNDVGVSYILMEQMPGRPWNGQGPHGKRFANDEDKQKLWDGLADILIELSRHTFSQIGSLIPRSSEPEVSALASERFLVLSPSGPFSTSKDYYASYMEQNMALIADGQLFPSYPVNAYLVFLYLKSQVETLVEDAQATEQFYLKHVDDKGDHLMVDDDLNIVGIIDWQMARIVPASEAFGPSLVTADMGAIYDGVSSLTVHDLALARFFRQKGEPDLANVMGGGEKIRRLFFGIDVDIPWEETLLLIRGIWAAFGIDRDMEWRDWKRDMMRKHSHDERLKGLIERFGV
ncbi:hypothetical protein N7456_013651 [Penicillium angulare]|uniref:Aminoglycoside phosphotransferase domain-containing protein n=1 Tax=Penicillium angulare TaxID=116970 RepID=A0A9W9JT64_9EURO|nr:hypothetical protein N7456_013651 [Penicillium angulare]